MNDTYVDLPDGTMFLRTVESIYAWSSQDRFFLKLPWHTKVFADSVTCTCHYLGRGPGAASEPSGSFGVKSLCDLRCIFNPFLFFSDISCHSFFKSG